MAHIMLFYESIAIPVGIMKRKSPGVRCDGTACWKNPPRSGARE